MASKRKQPRKRAGKYKPIPPPADDPANLNKTGYSRTPAGPPAAPEDVIALCQRLGLEAIHILRAIYKNTKASSGARVNAAAMVLERGYGKIAQAQAVAKPQETQGDLDNLTDSDILAALKRLAGREVVQGKAAAQSNTH